MTFRKLLTYLNPQSSHMNSNLIPIINANLKNLVHILSSLES